MRIEPTRDTAFILECLKHPKVWPHVICDGIDAEVLAVSPLIGYLCPIDDELGRLGIFVVEPKNPKWVEIHTALLPFSWGPKAAEAAKTVLQFLAQGGVRKVTTLVPKGNVLALRFAKKAGLHEEGCVSKSIPLNGVMTDQTLLGIELCQQPFQQ